jgi:hypothetical protein
MVEMVDHIHKIQDGHDEKDENENFDLVEVEDEVL